MMSENKHKRLKINIKIVTAAYFFAVIAILSTGTVMVGYNLYEDQVIESYNKYTETVLNYAYAVADRYSFGDMIDARNMPDGYEEMRSEFNQIKENSEIDYLYAIYFDDIKDIHSLTYAINSKTAEELSNGGSYTYMGTLCEQGSFEDDVLRTLQEAVLNRKKDCGLVSGYSKGYGYMFNGYRVIFDSAGEAAGIICVEINVDTIHGVLTNYIRNVAIFVLGFTIVMFAIFSGIAEYFFSNPIAKLMGSVRNFIRNIGDQDAMDEDVNALKMTRINSRTEIGELYSAVTRMESDMVERYREIQRYSESVMKMQDGLIVLLGDMVEFRDSDTGAHIQKTASYVRIILDGLKRKGYYEEQLTPRYIEYVVKSAPLHDTGKIMIPDSILNKPGKLTPEEYEIMKTHAALGKQIIEKAIKTVEGESYLADARDMAAYHHERWDGNGYPEGLKEEEIPLSARIMSVADVFDALASKRIYKPAFSKEKALEIIAEGKGTQFDPKCVEVFLESVPEIDIILEKYKDE